MKGQVIHSWTFLTVTPPDNNNKCASSPKNGKDFYGYAFKTLLSTGINGQNVGILTSVHYILIRWFIAKETCKSPTKPEIVEVAFWSRVEGN